MYICIYKRKDKRKKKEKKNNSTTPRVGGDLDVIDQSPWHSNKNLAAFVDHLELLVSMFVYAAAMNRKGLDPRNIMTQNTAPDVLGGLALLLLNHAVYTGLRTCSLRHKLRRPQCCMALRTVSLPVKWPKPI